MLSFEHVSKKINVKTQQGDDVHASKFGAYCTRTALLTSD